MEKNRHLKLREVALNKSTMNLDGMHKKDGQVTPGEVATLQS